MSQSDQKVVQHLGEAHASEIGLVSALQSQIGITARGSYRDGLEKHLDETREHARRIQERLGELGQGRNPVQAFVGFTEALISQTLALSKTPFGLLRGTSGEEKVLKNAKDACATEALEIATYTALERLATNVGDEQTAQLAASIRGDEQRMLERIMREIPKLTDAVVGADIERERSHDVTKTGAANAARKAKRTARNTQTRAKRTAQQARKIHAVAHADSQIEDGAVAAEEDLAIPRDDSLTAEEIPSKLPEPSQSDLSNVDSYERKNEDRTTVPSRISALQREPRPGHDEPTVTETEAVLGEGDEQHTDVADEQAHKNRTGVLNNGQRETANT
jgi:ferritin-like metal-binding protein YciE